MAITDMRVAVTLRSVDIALHCTCGAPVAGYHYIPDASFDAGAVAIIFRDAFTAHEQDAIACEAAVDCTQEHAARIRLENQDVSVGQRSL